MTQLRKTQGIIARNSDITLKTHGVFINSHVIFLKLAHFLNKG
jgi:hypothetical protein